MPQYPNPSGWKTFDPSQSYAAGLQVAGQKRAEAREDIKLQSDLAERLRIAEKDRMESDREIAEESRKKREAAIKNTVREIALDFPVRGTPEEQQKYIYDNSPKLYSHLQNEGLSEQEAQAELQDIMPHGTPEGFKAIANELGIDLSETEGVKEKNLGVQIHGFEATAPLTEEVREKYPNATSWGDIRRTPEYEDAFNDYIATTGGSQVLGTDEAGNVIVRPTRGNAPLNILGGPEGGIRSTQKPEMPAEQVARIATIDSMLNQFPRIREKAQQMPDKIGPIEGRWNKLQRKFMEDPEAEGLARETRSLIRMAYALSGKQISYQEMQLLEEAILPSLNQPDANFFAALDFAESWMQDERDSIVSKFEETNYLTPKPRKKDLYKKYNLEEK